MAANPLADGKALWRGGLGRMSYADRLRRLTTLPEEQLTPGDRAVRRVELGLETLVNDLFRMSSGGSPTAAKTLLEMSGLYTPGLKITGEIDHQHEHRVLQVNVRELTAEEFRALQEQNSPQRSLEAATAAEALETPSGAEAAAEAVSTSYSVS